MLRKGLYLILIFFLAALTGWTQALSTLVRKPFVILADTLVYDSLPTAANSLKAYHKSRLVDTSFYAVNPLRSVIVLKSGAFTQGDTLWLTYRRLPVSLATPYFNKDILKMEASEVSRNNPFSFVPGLKTDDPFNTKGLNKNGSISRGLSFGNNQDLVVNSNLNLQLSGNLTDDIEVLAAISDNNIPFQAEGNTQQLQEFDKVFIQLTKERYKLIAGDFVLSRPPSYFLNYLKKSQGASFSAYITPEQSKRQHQVSVSAGVSKGKFARNRIQGIEGNQGPYRLTGADNELFIIILSGTERVYIDGVLMKRGQEYDYTIDYNTAEIRFTTRQLITKDKRIVVEFDYSERSYSRSLIQVGDQYTTERLNFTFNVFSEQDNRNKPLLQELREDEKQLLREVGDSLQEALALNIDTVEFSGSEVLYMQRDTLINNLLYERVFVYSTNPELAQYRLGFSNVGQGRGNYRQVASAANGKVFEWIAPVDGIRQGAYEPVRLLITPKKKQMVTSSVEYRFNHGLKAGVEAALSNNDLNAFSSLHSSNDIGNATKLFIEKFSRIDSSRFLVTGANYERVDRYFSPFDRFRNVEFDRDWNLPVNAAFHDNQHLSAAHATFRNRKGSEVGYRFNSFIVENQLYEGYRNILTANINGRVIDFSGNASYLNSSSSSANTDFLRAYGVLSKKIKKVRVGAGENFERNRFSLPGNDSLQQASFMFAESYVFIADEDSSEKRYEFKYLHRDDFLPLHTGLKKATAAENFSGFAEVFKTESAALRISGTYRKLNITDSLLALKRPDETILGRTEFNQRLFKGILTTTLFYEAGSGLESKKQFSYVEVAAGLGYYTWKDYNENGVKELNEFEVAVFRDEARFIRVYIPTTEFIKVYNNAFSGAFNLNFAKWRDTKGLKKVMSYFSDQTSYRIDKKTNATRIEDAFNPFVSTENEPMLVTLASSFRNIAYFNRSGQVFSADHTFQETRSRTLLVNGFENRTNLHHDLHIRIGINRTFSFENDAILSRRTNSSAFFSNRDFQIISEELVPKFVIQPGTTFRLSFSYRYAEKENLIGDRETAFINKAGADLRYNVASKGSISASINVIDMNYNASSNTPVAFEMLESLKAGRNYTWNTSWQRNLSQNLQLSIMYDGRSSPETRVIHIGSVQVRAFF